jgi:hypothetical protein
MAAFRTAIAPDRRTQKPALSAHVPGHCLGAPTVAVIWGAPIVLFQDYFEALCNPPGASDI